MFLCMEGTLSHKVTWSTYECLTRTNAPKNCTPSTKWTSIPPKQLKTMKLLGIVFLRRFQCYLTSARILARFSAVATTPRTRLNPQLPTINPLHFLPSLHLSVCLALQILCSMYRKQPSLLQPFFLALRRLLSASFAARQSRISGCINVILCIILDVPFARTSSACHRSDLYGAYTCAHMYLLGSVWTMRMRSASEPAKTRVGMELHPIVVAASCRKQATLSQTVRVGSRAGFLVIVLCCAVRALAIVGGSSRVAACRHWI